MGSKQLELGDYEGAMAKMHIRRGRFLGEKVVLWSALLELIERQYPRPAPRVVAHQDPWLTQIAAILSTKRGISGCGTMDVVGAVGGGMVMALGKHTGVKYGNK